MFPRWDSVAALYCLQKSMMLTPCGPSAVPTGGAGVAAPAWSCTLTMAATFFFLGGMLALPYVVSLRAGTSQLCSSDLRDLVEGELDRCLPAEDRHEDLELLGVRVDLVHRGREGGERAIHHGNGIAGRVFHEHALGLRF